MSLDYLVYLISNLIDLKLILWAVFAYGALRFVWRLACIVLRDLHRFVVRKIEEAAEFAGSKIQAAISPSPEQAVLRAAWKREFRGTMTWAEFLAINAKLKGSEKVK
jgi:hypothetical protein